MKKRIRHRDEDSRRRGRGAAGFTLVEMMIVVTIVLITSAIALPQYMRMAHTAKLRGVASDFSGLVQVVRIRAVQDGKYYSLQTSNVQALGYVDLNGNGALDAGEPSIPISSEVTIIAAANAPDTTNLYNQFLPSGSAITVYDGGPLATPLTPITFGSRGIPCKTQTATGGTVCESGGGAIPFWVFFQNRVSGEQEAITVNPAGRVRKWYHGGGAWNAI
jgi:prepilin-type N-terminal cleavage/methylation domain-containing protein